MRDWQVTTGYRHLPFCISCALPVDNPSSQPATIPPIRLRPHKTAAIQRTNDSPLGRHFTSFILGKIRHALFLNCTKNTELTNAHFARTVTFARTQNNPTRSNAKAGWPSHSTGFRRTTRTRGSAT
jgi:hypothetical protein